MKQHMPSALLAFVCMSSACGGDNQDDPIDVDARVADGGTADATPVDGGVQIDAPTAVFQPVCGLLVNGDAETGDLSGWTVEEGAFRVVEGNFLQGFPDAYQGTYSFSAGEAARSRLAQTIELDEWGAFIDGRDIFVELSGHVRDWNGADSASLTVVAVDADGGELTRVQVGPYVADEWTARAAVVKLPAGSRGVTVELQGDRMTGADNDAYFDGLDVCLNDQPPAVVEGLVVSPYLMWMTQDGVSVRWETENPTIGVVEYGITDAVAMSASESTPTRVHEIRLTGLNPGQLHYYRVSWEGSYLPIETLRTAPADGDSSGFSFVVWGDNQNGPDTFSSLVPHMLAENPQFMLSVGDCVQNGTRGEYREQLFEPLAPLAKNVPFLIAAGNHERLSDSGAALFEEYMSQPGDEHCFGWRWGDVFFLFIDTELSIDAGSSQETCIRTELESVAAQTAAMQVAAFHKPPRIEWWFGGPIAFPESMEAPWVREQLEPMLADLGVDLVFNGHNHLYAYSEETLLGTTWVTTGGAGGMIDTDFALWNVGDWDEITTTIHDYHFLSVTVDAGVMTVTAIGLDGQSLHSFAVTP